MSNMLIEILGMGEVGFMVSKSEDATGKFVSDVDKGFYSLYVYADILGPRAVGDSEVPLLRTVPVQGIDGEFITREYVNPLYLPVERNHIDTINLAISKDTGELVPFERGKSMVTLHFRKIHSLI